LPSHPHEEKRGGGSLGDLLARRSEPQRAEIELEDALSVRSVLRISLVADAGRSGSGVGPFQFAEPVVERAVVKEEIAVIRSRNRGRSRDSGSHRVFGTGRKGTLLDRIEVESVGAGD